MPSLKVSFDVFLSYSSVNAQEVKTIAEILIDQYKLKPWLDQWQCIPGKPFIQQLAKGLDEAKTCAVIIGQQTPKGWFEQEISRALNRQANYPDFRVIPVILPKGDKSLLDGFLDLRTRIEFDNDISEESEIHKLVSGILGRPPGRIRKATKEKSKIEEEAFNNLGLLKKLRDADLLDQSINIKAQKAILKKLIQF